MTRARLTANILLVFISAIIIGVLGFLFFMRTLGYSVDIKNKKLIGKGGVKISSIPSGANVTLDSKRTRSNTDANILNLKVGTHKATLTKANYQNWDKVFDIKAKEMNFLDTAYMIPNDLILTPAWNYSDIKYIYCLNNKTICFFTMASNDVLMRLDYSEKDFKLSKVDISSKLLAGTEDGNTTTALEFDIKDSLYLGGDLIWFNIRKQGDAKDNMVVYNFASNQSFNLSSSHLIESGQLYRLDNNKVYILDQGKLRLISLNQATISTVIAENIVDLRLINDEYIFIQNIGGQYSAAKLYNGEKTEKLFNLIEYGAGTTIQMYINGGNRQYYIFDQSKGDVYEYRSFEGTTPTSIKKIFSNIKLISFSNDYGRFTAVDNDGKLWSYNCEYLTKNSNYITLPANYQIKSWANINTLLLIDNGQYKFMDYDGQNKYDFTSISASEQLYQFKKRKYLIIKKQDNHYSFYITDLDNVK